MEKKYILTLVIISFLLTNVIAFLDEGIRNFEYLKVPGDWVALIIYTILFLLLPLLIFFTNKKNLNARFRTSLLGFSPVILLIILQLR